MDRARTLLALAGITLMTAMVGSAGMIGARAEDFQAQGSHLNDPANNRTAADQQDPNKSRLNDPANARNLNDTQDPNKSRLNDPANARNLNDQQDPNKSRLNDAARRDPAADARNVDDKASKRDVK
jgi:hypothetical protein